MSERKQDAAVVLNECRCSVAERKIVLLSTNARCETCGWYGFIDPAPTQPDAEVQRLRNALELVRAARLDAGARALAAMRAESEGHR